MPSNYPAALDTTTNLPAAGGVGVNLNTFPHSVLHGNVDDAVRAIETELGVDPSGTSFTTVKARLDAVLHLTGGALTGNLSTTGTLTASGSLTAAGATITGTTALTTVTVANTIAVPNPTLFTQATNGQIRGSGSPETVVSAAVGMKYIDTAATNGAIEWVKASGVAATGWKVVYGDTGQRTMTASIGAGFTGALYMRRVMEEVTIAWNGIKSVDGDPLSEDILVIPAGFQAAATEFTAVNSFGNIVRSTNVTTGYWAMYTTPIAGMADMTPAPSWTVRDAPISRAIAHVSGAASDPMSTSGRAEAIAVWPMTAMNGAWMNDASGSQCAFDGIGRTASAGGFPPTSAKIQTKSTLRPWPLASARATST